MSDIDLLPMVGWYLEGRVSDPQLAARVPITRFPFSVGRRPDQSLQLRSSRVSGAHAVIEHSGSGLRIRDLGSTNGTFVNLRRIHELVELGPGDVLHFASLEFRVGYDDGTSWTSHTLSSELQTSSVEATLLEHALKGWELDIAFQPIVRLTGERTCLGFEALARPRSNGMQRGPARLFAAVAAVAGEAELGRRLRAQAAKLAVDLPGSPLLFLNTHPRELEEPQLLESVEILSALHPELRIVLEINEHTVTDPRRMRPLLEGLRALGVQLAYDDLGAGQARLLELVETDPSYVKFDRSLLTGLPHASEAKRRLVGTLVRMVHECGIDTVAEGIEKRDEAELCAELGFRHAQGWYFGRPRSIGHILGKH